MESLILRSVKPPGNKQKGKFAKSNDLFRRFKRDLKAKVLFDLGEWFGKKPKIQPRRKLLKEAEGRKPVLTRYIDHPLKLRARYTGKFLCTFVRKTGLIRCDGKHFTLPSLAGQHALKRRTCNGWRFWQYQRAPATGCYWMNCESEKPDSSPRPFGLNSGIAGTFFAF
jgi:hypothetical protein